MPSGDLMTIRSTRLAAFLVPALLAGAALAQGVAPPSGPALRSEVPALRIMAARQVPTIPKAARPEECRHLFTEARTAAGRAVAAAGWAVAREAALGAYQVVAFARRAEPGTSGTCQVLDGNVGVFRGAELVAIAYAPRGGAAIGAISPFGSDAVRIWDGDFLRRPVADLRLGADGALILQSLAAEERVCGGRAVVPNIYGRPIDQARALLLRHGWSPAPPPSRDGNDTRIAELVRRGVPEVEDCAGTGLGFCNYTYRGAAGTLSVTTAGDDEFPAVVGYGATCAPG